MTLFLMQVSPRPDPRVVLQEHFSKPAWDAASWTGIIAVAAAIAAFFVILHFIMYYQKRLRSPRQFRKPERLFGEMLSQLELTRAQRVLVARMVRDLRSPMPARILLSPKLFTQATIQWLASREKDRPIHEDQFREVVSKLFSST